MSYLNKITRRPGMYPDRIKCITVEFVYQKAFLKKNSLSLITFNRSTLEQVSQVTSTGETAAAVADLLLAHPAAVSPRSDGGLEQWNTDDVLQHFEGLTGVCLQTGFYHSVDVYDRASTPENVPL